MLLEGINDIGMLGGDATSAEALSAEDLIGAYKEIIELAHTRTIKVVGCTLTPYEGAGYFSEKGEAIRQAVNTWIRTSGAFDAVVDFDAATRDPNNPKRYRPEYDHGDHLHPGAGGPGDGECHRPCDLHRETGRPRSEETVDPRSRAGCGCLGSPDKQANKRCAVVAALGLTAQSVPPHNSCFRFYLIAN